MTGNNIPQTLWIEIYQFYEGYWLLNKFGSIKAHYSSLILTDQMSRSDALKKIENAPYVKKLMMTLNMSQIS